MRVLLAPHGDLKLATVFFSYSHQDEALRDKLEAHMAMLKKQGLVDAWHDRRIVAGDEFAGRIGDELERADVIVLLISSDFLSSSYCYDVEMRRAMERNDCGKARVIPVIARPCDWHSAPFGRLLAAPKDGKPIVLWPNHDEAFLDVIQKVRAAIPAKSMAANPTPPRMSAAIAPSGPRSSNLRVTKTFTQMERDQFGLDAFDYMRLFFDGSIRELTARNPGIDGKFRQVDADRFTAVLYKSGQAISKCKIARGGMMGGISYSNNDSASDNSFNESLTVGADEEELFLRASGMAITRNSSNKLSFEGAAEYYWSMLMEPLQRPAR